MNYKLREKIKRSTFLEKGFSLIELTVAVAIFSIIIVSAGNIFIQIFQAQKEMITKQILIDEGRYIMESMIKDIRMGYRFSTDNTEFKFTRYNEKAGLYCQANDVGICVQGGEYLAKIEGQVISSKKIKIKNLEFYVDKTNQPYVTVILVLEPKNYRGTKPLLRLQNTVKIGRAHV